MDVHKNARSVPASRVLLHKRVSEQGYSVRAASEAAGMSDRRCREWIRRAERHEPLTDRSSRPHTTSGISPETRVRVLDLRRERRTMRQVARIAGVSLSTVARVCKAEDLRPTSRARASATADSIRARCSG
jgi:transposase